MTRPSVVAIVGPTAVGKSGVAEGVAIALGGQIVSADSMQVYRGMDIGTAKTLPGDRRVPYHCVDLVDPGVAYSAALFQRDARDAISAIHAAGDLPVLAGGTGLYVRAALDDMHFPSGDTTSASRERLQQVAEGEGAAALHARLQAIDPASADLIHQNNVRRVIRALEMAQSGESYASQVKGFSVRRTHYARTAFVGLTMERATLYERIDSRVDAMMEAGLLAEVRALLAAGYRDALTSSQAIGYKEIVPVLDGASGLDEAVERVKQSTRRYAKRQLTWFRADPRVMWIDVTNLAPGCALAAVVELIESCD